MNPTIAKADLLAFAPEFLSLDVAVPPAVTTQLDAQLAVLDPMADLVVSGAVYPSTSPNGSQFSPIYTVKMLVICHWLKMSVNTEGRIASDRVGDLATTYAVPDVNNSNDWNNSVYGQRYIQMRRIYAQGISQSPRPVPPPLLQQ